MRLLVAIYIGSLMITSVLSQFQFSQFQYLGCFQDEGQRRLRGEFITFPYMTQETCLSYCKRRNFKYAGLQNGQACFCGDEAPVEDDKKPETECNVNCVGEIVAKCGGPWRNAIYSTGAVPPTDEYKGCYLDDANRRLQGYYTFIQYMSPRGCINHCRELLFKYAGLQNGNECFCGNEEQNCWEQRNENECNTTCLLDSTFKCGAGWRNSIYKTLIAWNSSYEYVFSDYTYLGCFLDSAERRLRGEYILFPYMTRQMCLRLCKIRSFKYAGLQNGNLCFCGDEVPLSYDLKPDTECNSDCPGEQGLKCGGAWRNAIYSTGKVPPRHGYLGCYLDVEGYRKLKGFYMYIDQMTPRSCIDRCRNMSYKYAGLQAGTHCFCGNDDPQDADKRNENECSSTCPNDYTTKCGGGLRNSIYRTTDIIQNYERCPDPVTPAP